MTARDQGELPGWQVRHCFARRFEALPAIFTFVGETLLAHGVDQAERHAIEFTIEELFTNIVKYNPGGAGEIELELEVHAGELVVRICDPDSERFDVTSTPDADLDALAEQRRPGGLGLHLIRRLVDSIEYDYSGRRSLVIFRRARRQA